MFIYQVKIQIVYVKSERLSIHSYQNSQNRRLTWKLYSQTQHFLSQDCAYLFFLK